MQSSKTVDGISSMVWSLKTKKEKLNKFLAFKISLIELVFTLCNLK